ncbi:transposase [Acinetobacter harbinensis]|nr:transposase [Acinetobacter harbinensis]
MLEQLIIGLKAKLYADHGYIAQNLKQNFKMQPIELIIYHRKNMQTMN